MNKINVYVVIDNKANAWSYYEVRLMTEEEYINTKEYLDNTVGSVSNIDSVWDIEQDAYERTLAIIDYYQGVM